jgi:putative membrane protein
MKLTAREQAMIATTVAALEAITGAQVVAAVVGKADSYPEAPWKAFALGASASALAGALWQLASGGWAADFPPAGHVLVILGGGALLALLATLFLPVARLFVDRARREVEVMQFAQALFFRRGLDRTHARLGILLLVSLFERRVVILADEGFDGRIAARDWSALTTRITLLQRHAGTAVALRAGLDALLVLLLERGYRGPEAGNELPDILELKDAR